MHRLRVLFWDQIAKKYIFSGENWGTSEDASSIKEKIEFVEHIHQKLSSAPVLLICNKKKELNPQMSIQPY